MADPLADGVGLGEALAVPLGVGDGEAPLPVLAASMPAGRPLGLSCLSTSTVVWKRSASFSSSVL